MQIGRVALDDRLVPVSRAQGDLRFFLRVGDTGQDGPGVARPRQLLVWAAQEDFAVEGGLADCGAEFRSELRGGNA